MPVQVVVPQGLAALLEGADKSAPPGERVPAALLQRPAPAAAVQEAKASSYPGLQAFVARRAAGETSWPAVPLRSPTSAA